MDGNEVMTLECFYNIGNFTTLESLHNDRVRYMLISFLIIEEESEIQSLHNISPNTEEMAKLELEPIPVTFILSALDHVVPWAEVRD